MKIHKVLNNNVVVVLDEHENEKIVMGKGLAFKKRAGDCFDETLVDKVFSLSNPDASNKFKEMVKDVPIDHVEMGEEIVSYAKSHLGKKLDDMIYISLTDHVYASITRFLDGITVKNALLYDIRRFYPEEYEIGLRALDMVEERFKVRLPQDEAGFVALHIVNAEMDEEGVQTIYEITKIMQEVTNIVKYVFNIEFDESSVYFYRFITHLKYFAQRLVSKKTYVDETDDGLLEMVKLKYQNAYKCVCRISNFIQKKYDYALSNEEMLYLTIHIERVVYKSKK